MKRREHIDMNAEDIIRIKNTVQYKEVIKIFQEMEKKNGTLKGEEFEEFTNKARQLDIYWRQAIYLATLENQKNIS